MKEKQLEFLNKTIEKYTLKNRGYNKEREVCFYSPSNESPGCAIGSEVSLEIAKKLDEINYGVNDNYTFNLLPDNLKQLGQNFLTAIQNLHDTELFWDIEGLSDIGKNQVNNIKEKFDL